MRRAEARQMAKAAVYGDGNGIGLARALELREKRVVSRREKRRGLGRVAKVLSK